MTEESLDEIVDWNFFWTELNVWRIKVVHQTEDNDPSILYDWNDLLGHLKMFMIVP